MVTDQTKFKLRIFLPLLVRDICLWLYWLLHQKLKLFLKFSDIFNGWQRHLHVNDSDQSRDVFVMDYYTAVYQITIGNHLLLDKWSQSQVLFKETKASSHQTYFSEQFFNVILVAPFVEHISECLDKKRTIWCWSVWNSVCKQTDSNRLLIAVY